MTLVSENTTRKIDNLGRLSIPKSLRDRFHIKPNDEIEFSVCQMESAVYICLNKKGANIKAEKLVEDLDSLGIEPPEELLKLLD